LKESRRHHSYHPELLVTEITF